MHFVSKSEGCWYSVVTTLGSVSVRLHKLTLIRRGQRSGASLTSPHTLYIHQVISTSLWTLTTIQNIQNTLVFVLSLKGWSVCVCVCLLS